MVMFQKTQYCYDNNPNTLTVKIPVDFFLLEIEKLILKFIYECKTPKTTKQFRKITQMTHYLIFKT